MKAYQIEVCFTNGRAKQWFSENEGSGKKNPAKFDTIEAAQDVVSSLWNFSPYIYKIRTV